MFLSDLFNTLPLVCVGFTTSFGTQRMILVSEKLDMTMEARIGEVRYYKEKYYDPFKMVLIHEEWEKEIADFRYLTSELL